MSKNIFIINPEMSDNASVTASNTHGDFPITDLQTIQPSQKWRTQSLTDITLMIDLGSEKAFDFVSLIGTNATDTATWRIRAALSNASATYLGADLITNGNMELDSNWANDSTPLVNERSSEQAHAGTYSRKFTADSSGDGVKGNVFTTSTGETYQLIAWVYPASTTETRILVRNGANSGYALIQTFSTVTTGAWNRVAATYTESAGGTGAFVLLSVPVASIPPTTTWYFDDVSLRRTGTAETYDSSTTSHWPVANLSSLSETTAMIYTSAIVSARYLRIDVTDSTNSAGYYEAGRLFVSEVWQPTKNISYGWSLSWKDISLQQESLGGNTIITDRSKYRVVNFSLDFLDEDEMYDNAYVIDYSRGRSKDIFIVRDYDNVTHRYRQSLHGVLTTLSPIINSNFNIFRKKYTVKELL